MLLFDYHLNYQVYCKSYLILECYEKFRYKVGQVRYPETSTANPQVVHVLYDVVPDKLCLSDSSLKIRWFFLTAIGVSKAEVFDAYNQGKPVEELRVDLNEKFVFILNIFNLILNYTLFDKFDSVHIFISNCC